MTREERIICDNENCKDGKHYFICGNGHDICSLCLVTLQKKEYCPICLELARLKI
jgi:hypothetical protein